MAQPATRPLDWTDEVRARLRPSDDQLLEAAGDPEGEAYRVERAAQIDDMVTLHRAIFGDREVTNYGPGVRAAAVGAGAFLLLPVKPAALVAAVAVAAASAPNNTPLTDAIAEVNRGRAQRLAALRDGSDS